MFDKSEDAPFDHIAERAEAIARVLHEIKGQEGDVKLAAIRFLDEMTRILGQPRAASPAPERRLRSV